MLEITINKYGEGESVRKNYFYLFIFGILLIYFFLIFFSQKALAYSIDDFLLDIMMLYQNNLNPIELEAINARIFLFSKTLENDKEKIDQLYLKLSSLTKKQRLLVYKVLKKYLKENILIYLFADIIKPKEIDLNSKIEDKTKSINVVDNNYIFNPLDKNKKDDKEENKDKQEKDKQESKQSEEDKNNNSQNQSTNQSSNSKDQNKNNQDNNKKNQTDSSNQKNEKKNDQQNQNNENKNENKNDQQNQNKANYSLEGLKAPQVQEIYNKYSLAELDSIYKDAIKLYYSNDLEKSFLEFWICLVNSYNLENSSYYLGLIYEKKLDYDSAIILYKNAINLFLAKQSIDSKFISFLYKRLGVSYNQKQLFEEAILYLKKSIEYHPSDGETYFQIGFAYYNLKNFDKAKEYFQKALQLGYQKAQEYLKKLG